MTRQIKTREGKTVELGEDFEPKKKRKGGARRMLSNEVEALWDEVQAKRAATFRWVAPAKQDRT